MSRSLIDPIKRRILVPFCFIAAGLVLGAQTNASARKVRSEGPCQAAWRCQTLAEIGTAKSPEALRGAAANGCSGFPEQAVRALRAYQLRLPGAANLLINTMPRGLGDITSLLYLTTAPGSETAADFQIDLQAGGPQDQIPPGGCGDFDSRSTRGYFAAYFEAIAEELPSYPQFIPRFLEITQLFGNLDRARYFLAPDHGYSPVDAVGILDGLLRDLYRRDPAAVRKAARFTVLGKAALTVAQSAALRKPGNKR